MKETGTGEPTPEQLLQILTAQLASQRVRTTASSRNRALVVVGGLIFILVAASVAFLVLDQMLADYRPNGRTPQGESTGAR